MSAEETQVFRIKYAGEPNIKCKGCGTYAETEDVIFGVATSTMGVQGSFFWRHFDCADVANVRQCFEQSQDLSEVIKGWHSLGEDDQDFVMETFTDISQGLGKENIRKHRLRGRKTRIEVEEVASDEAQSKENVEPSASEPAQDKPAATPWFEVAKAKKQKELQKKKEAKEAAEAKARAKAEAKAKREAAKKEREEKKAAKAAKAAEAARRRALRDKRDRTGEGAITEEEQGDENASTGGDDAAAPVAAPKPAAKKRRRTKSTKPAEPKKEKQLKGGPMLAKKAEEFFYDEKRESLRSLYPEATLAEVKSMISDAWNALTVDERMPFDSMASGDKARYTRQLKEFKAEGKFTVLDEDKHTMQQPSLLAHRSKGKELGFAAVVKPKMVRQGSFGAGFERTNSFSHSFGRRKASSKKKKSSFGFSPV